MKIQFKLFKSLWLWAFVVQVLLALFLYLNKIRPHLISFSAYGFNVDNSFNLFTADTYVYWFYASEVPFLLIPLNLIGPASLFKILELNFDLAILLNFSLFFFVLREIYRYIEISVFPFAVLLLANPYILGNFTAINKEIIIIFSLLFLIVFIKSGRTKHAIVAIIIALFSKLEFFALIIFFLASRRLNSKWRPLILVLIVIAISITYNYIPKIDSYINILMVGQNDDSIGFNVFLNEIATNYNAYFITILPRLLLNIYSGGFFGILFFISLIPFIFIKKLNKSDDIIYFICLYVIMVTILPFPLYRYILPVYPLLLFLSMHRILPFKLS